MSETNMPAAEASVANEKEVISYEYAFHVLPTVAEGEVPSVVDKIKAHITKAGGEIFDEEVAQRFDLAYEISKYLEGRNRKFSSAYFGWVRFRIEASSLEALTAELETQKEVLRYLLVKLTKVEEQNPFRFHESIADRKVRTITDEEVVEVVEAAEAEEVAVVEDAEVAAEVVAEADDKVAPETV
jgi:ribosomal protein S6